MLFKIGSANDILENSQGYANLEWYGVTLVEPARI